MSIPRVPRQRKLRWEVATKRVVRWEVDEATDL